MIQNYSSRKAIVGAVICFVLIVAFYHSYEPYNLVDPTTESLPADSFCHIWPDWEGSSPAYLRYKEVKSHKLPVIGDASFIGSSDRCLSAGSRLNQYKPSPDRNWTDVRWGEVQKRCAGRKYKLQDEFNGGIWHQLPKHFSVDTTTTTSGEENGGSRTAIVLRTWDDYKYTDARRAWLRAFITETALHSDGEYEVFFLVNVKDDEVRLSDDPDAYAQALREYVPEEFRDMALLYNRPVLETWYPRVEEHGAQDQMYQALQIFSHRFPHFDHVWQLEMDLRTTGHLGATLDHAIAFARAQPRRNLWERNGRFYIPELHGRSYANFASEVEAEIGDDGVWGPTRTAEFEPKGPEPPARSHHDWGVDEDADLVSFMPMIDPKGTDWVYENDVYGFADGKKTPRRAAFVAMTRSSRRLLQLVSEAQRERGQWVVSEATLETFALLHGLKAVTVPHPIALSKSITPERADELVNRGPPHSKAGGEAPSMAYTINGFVEGPWNRASYWFAADKAPDFWHRYIGGECIPPMMLHPVKDE